MATPCEGEPATDGDARPASETRTPATPDREAWLDALARLADVPFMEEGRGQPPPPPAEAIEPALDSEPAVTAWLAELDRNGAAEFLEGWERDQPPMPPARDLDD